MARQHSALIGVEGPFRDNVYRLSEREWQVVGRSITSAVLLDDPEVADKHALFTFRDQRWHVQDLQSPTGTKVNGQSIVDETPLAQGDRVQVGRTVFRLCYGEGLGSGSDLDFEVLKTITPANSNGSKVTPAPQDDSERADQSWSDALRTAMGGAVSLDPNRQAPNRQDKKPSEATGEHATKQDRQGDIGQKSNDRQSANHVSHGDGANGASPNGSSPAESANPASDSSQSSQDNSAGASSNGPGKNGSGKQAESVNELGALPEIDNTSSATATAVAPPRQAHSKETQSVAPVVESPQPIPEVVISPRDELPLTRPRPRVAEPEIATGSSYHPFLIATAMLVFACITIVALVALNVTSNRGQEDKGEPKNPGKVVVTHDPTDPNPKDPKNPNPNGKQPVPGVGNPPAAMAEAVQLQADVAGLWQRVATIDRTQGFARMIDKAAALRIDAIASIDQKNYALALEQFRRLKNDCESLVGKDKARQDAQIAGDKATPLLKELLDGDTAILALIDASEIQSSANDAKASLEKSDFAAAQLHWDAVIKDAGRLQKQYDRLLAERGDADAARSKAQTAQSGAQAIKADQLSKQGWAAAVAKSAAATTAYDDGRFVDAAKHWQDAEQTFAAIARMTQNNQKLGVAKKKFDLALASSDTARLKRYGGEAWALVDAAVQAAQTADDDLKAAAAYEKALSLLPTAQQAAQQQLVDELWQQAQQHVDKAEREQAVAVLDALLKVEPGHKQAASLHLRITSIKAKPKALVNSVGMKLIYLPAGEYMRGTAEGFDDRQSDETAHQVTLTRSFSMAVTEVTQSQWAKVMGADTNPSRFKGDNLPVEGVTYEQAVAFCQKLSKLENRSYRLPTEAEWEYACRAGTTTRFSSGDSEIDLIKQAWVNAPGSAGDSRATRPVGKGQPNPWGLYDMHGNVWEWCSDLYGEYPDKPVTDPTGAKDGKYHVIRGGSWFNAPGFARSARRGKGLDGVLFGLTGFRVVLETKAE